jgi:hypothetical protein
VNGGKFHDNLHENVMDILLILSISKHPGTGSQKCLQLGKYLLESTAVSKESLEIVSWFIFESLSEI